ncbi:MAG: NfeD family protein [Candidatus Methylacidiphilales bacterium]
MTIIIGLLIAGSLLLLSEIFLPGMIAGFIGVLCYLAAVVWVYQEYGIQPAAFLFLAEAAVGTLGFLIWFRYFPASRAGQMFSLPETPLQRSMEETADLAVGQTGITLTPLRPSGKARIQGRRIDAVSEGRPIEKNTEVKIVKIEGSRIVVRILETETTIETP